MYDDVKLPAPAESIQPRAYDSAKRRAAAAKTRTMVMRAAAELFLAGGYRFTTMAAIAARAGVAVDTIYATCGKKPDILRELIERAISGEDAAIPALQRSYVNQMAALPDAAAKLRRYARAIREIQPRLSPIVHVLHDAAATDPGLAALWEQIAERRAANMRLFAADLIATNQLRSGLTTDEIADTIWAMNGPEFYHLLVEQRGWSLDRFEAWLGEAWTRLLVEPVGPQRPKNA